MKSTTKKKIIISIIVGAAVIASVYFIVKKLRKGKIKNKNPKSILFVGDSQTAVKSPTGGDITYTFPNYIKPELEKKGISMDVLAKGGETTNWMLKNLPEKLKEKKYDRIYIQGGGNDSTNEIPYEKYKGNIEKMIELGQQAGSDVFFMVWFDREKIMDPNKVATTIYVPSKEEMYKRHQIYFAWQKKIGKDLEDKANGIIPMFQLEKGDVADGIHPNAKGSKKIANIILKTI